MLFCRPKGQSLLFPFSFFLLGKLEAAPDVAFSLYKGRDLRLHGEGFAVIKGGICGYKGRDLRLLRRILLAPIYAHGRLCDARSDPANGL